MLIYYLIDTYHLFLVLSLLLLLLPFLLLDIQEFLVGKQVRARAHDRGPHESVHRRPAAGNVNRTPARPKSNNQVIHDSIGRRPCGDGITSVGRLLT